MPLSISGGALSWQRLAVINHHLRDDNIAFEEASHTYSIDGDAIGWMSCTTIISNLYEHFDPDAIIKKMRSNPTKFAEGPYAGKTDEEIKAGWNANGTIASEAGTRMHSDIERYYNASPVGNLAGDDYEPLESAEWSMFLDYQRKHGEQFHPYRTEWLVWDRSVMIAGSIDMVYRKQDGTLAIYDWKRAKEIKTENRWQSMLGPVNHLPDTNYWHYSIQLNVYRRILESWYGETVSELALVILHPNQKSFRVLKVNLMDDEVDAIFECRRCSVLEAKAAKERGEDWKSVKPLLWD
jgi:hypothetical protein